MRSQLVWQKIRRVVPNRPRRLRNSYSLPQRRREQLRGSLARAREESAARRWRGGRYIFSTGRMVLWNTEPADQASSSSHEDTPVASRRDSRKKYCRSSFGKPERRKRERFFRRRNSG